MNINADHMVLIEQRDWSVSYAYVTMDIIHLKWSDVIGQIHLSM